MTSGGLFFWLQRDNATAAEDIILLNGALHDVYTDRDM